MQLMNMHNRDCTWNIFIYYLLVMSYYYLLASVLWAWLRLSMCAKCSIITVPLFQDVSKSTSKPEESVVEGKSLVIFCLVIMRGKSMVALVTARHSPCPPRLLHSPTHAQTSEQSIVGQLPAILQTFHLFDIAGAKAITLYLSFFFDVFVGALFGLQIISVAWFCLSHAIRVLSFGAVIAQTSDIHVFGTL